MTAYQKLYAFVSKSFKYEPVKKLKRSLRPLKWAVVGKEGIYKAIGLVNELQRESNKGDVRTVFDIGAADGEYALTFAKSFPEATVFCFEPQSVSYRRLEKKTKPLSGRMKLHKFGFYDDNAAVPLNLNLSHPDGSSILNSPALSAGQKNPGMETIQVRRLDDFVAEQKIQHIDFMKIDVEGVEKELLEGGMKTLAEKVNNLFIEISLARKGLYSSNYIDVLKIIHACGFALLDISENENFFFSKLA